MGLVSEPGRVRAAMRSMLETIAPGAEPLELGALLELPQWLLDVSPFTHVPAVPAEPFAAAPLLWLGAAALALGALGFAAFRRRDLAIPG